jgi:ATP-dependent RNA helicase DDX60
MDLEDFDNLNENPGDIIQHLSTAADALNKFDSQWYTKLTRTARWMDLIGDYAGREAFIIDGIDLPLLFDHRGLTVSTIQENR